MAEKLTVLHAICVDTGDAVLAGMNNTNRSIYVRVNVSIGQVRVGSVGWRADTESYNRLPIPVREIG